MESDGVFCKKFKLRINRPVTILTTCTCNLSEQNISCTWLSQFEVPVCVGTGHFVVGVEF